MVTDEASDGRSPPRWSFAGLARTTGIYVCLALLPLVAFTHPPEAGATANVVVIDRAIGTGSDDAEQRVRRGTVALTSSDMELSTDGSTVQTIGLRFTDIVVPPDAAITAAWVQFRVDEVSTGAASLTIAGQAADNAPTFTGVNADVSSRPRTTATVHWAPPPWRNVHAAGTRQRTPDLATVIDEIVSRPGWAPGNALALVITGHRAAHRRGLRGHRRPGPAPRVRRQRSATTGRDAVVHEPERRPRPPQPRDRARPLDHLLHPAPAAGGDHL